MFPFKSYESPERLLPEYEAAIVVAAEFAILVADVMFPFRSYEILRSAKRSVLAPPSNSAFAVSLDSPSYPNVYAFVPALPRCHSSQSPCTKTCPLRLVLQIGVHRVATNDPYAPRSANTLDAFCPKSCEGVWRSNPVREISPVARTGARKIASRPGFLPKITDGTWLEGTKQDGGRICRTRWHITT